MGTESEKTEKNININSSNEKTNVKMLSSCNEVTRTKNQSNVFVMADHINLLSSLKFSWVCVCVSVFFARAFYSSHMCSPQSFSLVSLLLLMVYARAEVNTDIENSSTSDCVFFIIRLAGFDFFHFLFLQSLSLSPSSSRAYGLSSNNKECVITRIFDAFHWDRSFGRSRSYFCL